MASASHLNVNQTLNAMMTVSAARATASISQVAKTIPSVVQMSSASKIYAKPFQTAWVTENVQTMPSVKTAVVARKPHANQTTIVLARKTAWVAVACPQSAGAPAIVIPIKPAGMALAWTIQSSRSRP